MYKLAVLGVLLIGLVVALGILYKIAVVDQEASS